MPPKHKTRRTTCNCIFHQKHPSIGAFFLKYTMIICDKDEQCLFCKRGQSPNFYRFFSDLIFVPDIRKVQWLKESLWLHGLYEVWNTTAENLKVAQLAEAENSISPQNADTLMQHALFLCIQGLFRMVILEWALQGKIEKLARHVVKEDYRKLLAVRDNSQSMKKKRQQSLARMMKITRPSSGATVKPKKSSCKLVEARNKFYGSSSIKELTPILHPYLQFCHALIENVFFRRVVATSLAEER